MIQMFHTSWIPELWLNPWVGQSSGIHDVWNIWIIYPLIAWALLTAAVSAGSFTCASQFPKVRSSVRLARALTPGRRWSTHSAPIGPRRGAWSWFSCCTGTLVGYSATRTGPPARGLHVPGGAVCLEEARG